ncbi:MAG: DUF2877 domain-containing protein [Pseudomonadota bacterium]|nr:DUF2877 domain-containing protein [Pseudomonadota bacterium]
MIDPSPAVPGQLIDRLPQGTRAIGQVVTIGSLAHDVTQHIQKGRVTAVFARSLYFESDGHWVCMGGVDLGRSTLTINVRNVGEKKWLDYFPLGTTIAITRSFIEVAGSPVIALEPLALWSAPQLPAWTSKTLKSGLQSLLVLAPSVRLPTDGLGQYLHEDINQITPARVVRAARQSVADLTHWLSGARDQPSESHYVQRAVSGLIGLGPGLTPAGDDFLVGVLVALALCHRWGQHRCLATAVAAQLGRTGPVSRAHLRAAVIGEGGEVLHATLAALVTGDHARLARALVDIDRTGHSSGWDTLAGAILVMRHLVQTGIMRGWHRSETVLVGVC